MRDARVDGSMPSDVSPLPLAGEPWAGSPARPLRGPRLPCRAPRGDASRLAGGGAGAARAPARRRGPAARSPSSTTAPSPRPRHASLRSPARTPDDPVLPYLQALALEWRLEQDPAQPGPRPRGARVRRPLARPRRTPRSGATATDRRARLARGAAHGVKSRLHLFRWEKGAASREAVRMREALAAARAEGEDALDLDFGLGLYDYYADTLPALLQARGLRPPHPGRRPRARRPRHRAGRPRRQPLPRRRGAGPDVRHPLVLRAPARPRGALDPRDAAAPPGLADLGAEARPAPRRADGPLGRERRGLRGRSSRPRRAARTPTTSRWSRRWRG